MRPVVQTAGGYPFGDCVRAAWASLLGVPIGQVPRFDPGHLGAASQLAPEREWIRGLGYDTVVVPAGADMDIPADVPHLITGLSPRGQFGHRCVGRGGRLAWDPHPSHAGLREVWSFTFLVPLIDQAEAPGADLIGFAGWLP